MATLTVEGIPAALLARLRLAAAGSGRSLNSEVIVQLVRSVGASRRPGGEAGGPAAAVGWGGPPASGEEGGGLRS